MKTALLHAAVVAALALCGCATLSRQAFIETEAGKYEYEKPLSEVWPHAKALLKEEGFAFKESEADKVLATEWKEQMASSSVAANYTRYLVQGFETQGDDGSVHCQIRITRHSMNSGGLGDSAATYETNNREVTGGQGGSSPNPDMDSASYGQQQAAAAARGQTGGRNTSNSNSTRDLRMEWLLMQRADPENAAQLSTYADGHYK